MLHKQIIKSVEGWLESNPIFYTQALKFYKENDFIHVSTIDCPEICIKDYFCQEHGLGIGHQTYQEKLIPAALWQHVLKGDIEYSIQETPRCFMDGQQKENDDLVKSYVKNVTDGNIIDAAFWGGTHGEDGFVEFKTPPISKKTHFPLEVGYCKSTQFFYQLVVRRCIARLPYNSDYIIYFEIVNNDLYNIAI